MSAFPPIATELRTSLEVRFVPEAAMSLTKPSRRADRGLLVHLAQPRRANRAIPPVALGIEPKPSDLANCMAESVLACCPVCGARSQMIGVSSQDAASTFDYRPMRCADDPEWISKRLRQQRPAHFRISRFDREQCARQDAYRTANCECLRQTLVHSGGQFRSVGFARLD